MLKRLITLAFALIFILLLARFVLVILGVM